MAAVVESIRDAAQDAVNGLRVAFLTGSLDSAREMQQALGSAEMGGLPRVLRRRCGGFLVGFPKHGGSILFQSVRSSLRGISVDHVYLPASVGPELMDELSPVVCTSKDAAIIDYI